MADSDRSKAPKTAPRWQQPSSSQREINQMPTTRRYSTASSDSSKLEIARRFLEEDHVRTASREKKIEFLRTKGVSEANIRELLGKRTSDEAEGKSTTANEDYSENEDVDDRGTPSSSPTISWSWPSADEFSSSSPSSSSPAAPILPTTRPPVVTYPEFLANPERPGPLVTKSGLVNTLCAVAGFSTILYGASKYVVSPMIESLTDARVQLQETTAEKLDDMVAKLENTVSVIPHRANLAEGKDKVGDDGDAASDDDPSEMFHRDFGTQTSTPASPYLSFAQKNSAPVSASAQHAHRLSQFTKSLSSLKDDFQSQDERLQDVEVVLDMFRDDLDGMTYSRGGAGGGGDYAGKFDMYGKLKRSEPDDEIRKARDNIRRIKGILLSTRSFPTSVG